MEEGRKFDALSNNRGMALKESEQALVRPLLLGASDVHLPQNLFRKGIERISPEGLLCIEMNDLDAFTSKVGCP